ncbi:MAG: DUF2974 domain-containing protein [Bacteroidaceae bacterium]|nr:DUF2974 domain-containing protein [Bacteroidaceae bacterium]
MDTELDFKHFKKFIDSYKLGVFHLNREQNISKNSLERLALTSISEIKNPPPRQVGFLSTSFTSSAISFSNDFLKSLSKFETILNNSKRDKFLARYDEPHILLKSKIEDPLIYDAAQIALHVYGDEKDAVVPQGWKMQEFKPSYKQKSDLKYGLYQKGDQYIYAIAGTDNIGDWGTNLSQFFLGQSNEYDDTYEIVKELIQKVDNLFLVGHSKGGGQAAYGAIKINENSNKHIRAITFNPIGTQEKQPVVKDYIQTYINLDDPLNLFLDFIGTNQADGVRHYLLPTDDNTGSIIDGHDMKDVIRSLNSLK